MDVEASRDQHQFRREGIHGWQQNVLPGGAESGAVRPGWERSVQHIANPTLSLLAGTGIERPLVGGGVEDAGVPLHAGLAAIAMMRVEVADGDALEPVHRLGMAGSNDAVSEQAEAHRPRWFRMVAGWADGAEDAAHPTGATNFVHGGHAGTGGAQRGLGAAMADPRVVIQREGLAGFRPRREDSLDVVARMDPAELLQCGPRRLVADQ